MSYIEEFFVDYTNTIFVGNGTSKEDCISIARQMLDSDGKEEISLFDGIRLQIWGYEKKHIGSPKIEDFIRKIETDGAFEIDIRSDKSLPKRILLPILENHPEAKISMMWRVNEHYNDYENEGWTFCDLDWADDSYSDSDDALDDGTEDD